MARDSQRLEQEFITTVKEKTGKDLAEWLAVVAAAGLEKKTNTILNWLKTQHGLNHMQANFIAGIYMNDGQPVFDYDRLWTNIFAGKDHLRLLYDTLQNQMSAALPEAEFIPTKAYVSIEGKRCFACATLTKHLIRVGLDLGDLPFDDYTQKAKSLGAMPNLSHMIEVSDATHVNDQLLHYVQHAYYRVHPKA